MVRWEDSSLVSEIWIIASKLIDTNKKQANVSIKMFLKLSKAVWWGSGLDIFYCLRKWKLSRSTYRAVPWFFHSHLSFKLAIIGKNIHFHRLTHETGWFSNVHTSSFCKILKMSEIAAYFFLSAPVFRETSL